MTFIPHQKQNFEMQFNSPETKTTALKGGKRNSVIRLAILSKYQTMTDGQTERCPVTAAADLGSLSVSGD